MERGNGNTVLLTVIGVATLLVALVGATFAYFTANVTNNSSQSLSITTAAPVALETSNSTTVIDMANAVPGTTDGPQVFTVTNPSTGNVKQSYDISLVVDSDTFNTTCTTGKATAAVGTIASGATYTCEAGESYASDRDAAFADQLELTIVQATSNATTAANVSTLKMTDASDGAVGASEKGATANTVKYNLTDGATVSAAGSYKLAQNQEIMVGEAQTYTMTLNFKEINLNQSSNAASDNGGGQLAGKTFVGHLAIDNVKAIAE